MSGEGLLNILVLSSLLREAMTTDTCVVTDIKVSFLETASHRLLFVLEDNIP